MPTSSMPACMARSNDDARQSRFFLGQVNPAVGRPMVGFLKKLERTDVPFLQAAETLYGQGGKVHVHPANAAAILFRTVNRVNEFHT